MPSTPASPTAFTLQVVEPHLNGPGGDVPVIVHDVQRGKPEVICGQGVAPAGATIAHYRSEGLDLVPGTGLLAACVPGTFETWMMLLRDYGTMSLADVLAPAIGYAQNGYPLLERTNATIAHGRRPVPRLLADLGRGLSAGQQGAGDRLAVHQQDARRHLCPHRQGSRERRRRPRCANRACAANPGRKVLSPKPSTASAAPRTSWTPAASRHRGVLTADDMARWTPHIEAPLTYDYRGYTVCKTGPWGQGPVTLQQLALLKGFDLDGLDPTGPDFIHLLVECSKLAYADREVFYGDPDFVEVPMATLLSDAYNAERRKLVTDKASLELRPGSIEGFGAVVKLRRDAVPHAAGAGEPTVGRLGAGEPTVGRMGNTRGDTVHFDIVDQAGNMISSTPSGGWLHSSPVIPELGFCLGTRAQMFWLEEGHPAALGPGRRPRTTLSPTMALRDGEPYLAWGSPGGDGQDQWITQFFLRHVHCRHEYAGSDRRAGLAFRAFPELVLAAHRAARRAGGRRPRAAEDRRRAQAPRPQGRGRPRLVGRPAHRRVARRPAPPRRRQCARHAGLRGGAVRHRLHNCEVSAPTLPGMKTRGDHAQQAQALVGKLGVTCPAIRSSIDSSSRRSTRSAAIKVRMSGSDNAVRSVNS